MGENPPAKISVEYDSSIERSIMATRRTLKAAQAIREVVAMSLLTDLKDPRCERVTITSVEVSGDMRLAKVFFTVLGNDPAKERLAIAGLTSAAGFLQSKCARRIDTRYTPKLQFAVDEGVKNLAAVTAILAQEARERQVAEDDSAESLSELEESEPSVTEQTDLTRGEGKTEEA